MKKITFFLTVALIVGNSCVFAGITCMQNNYLGFNVAYDFVNGEAGYFSPNSSLLFTLGTSASYTPANAGLTYAYGGECLFNTSEEQWYTSFIIINIDGTPYDAEDNWPLVGDITNTGSDISGIKTINNYINLEVDYKFVNNPSTNINADTVEFEFTATNIDPTNSHNVSLMLLIDDEVNGNDGAIVSTDDGFTTIANNEIFYKSTPMSPDWWDFDVNPLTGTPNLVGRGHLYNNPYGDPATEPDIFIAGSWADMADQLFTTSNPWGLITSGDPIGDDSAVELWWTDGNGGGLNSNYSLPPGQSLTWVAYYGLNQGVLLATPTSTATYTSSPTMTPSMTFTITPTASGTQTITPTFTETFTYTVTPTYTLTATPTCTFTITPTYTITPTSTMTYTITQTSTITPTYTITMTATPTPCLTLYKNSPNPFSQGTYFIFDLCSQSQINVKIYTVSGEVVTELTQQSQPGRNSVYWNATNKSGRGVASGVYIYSLEAVDGNERKKEWGKMAVVK